MLRPLLTLIVAALLALVAGRAAALTPGQALAIAQGDSSERIDALNQAVAAADPALAAYVQALLDDEIRLAGGKVWRVQGEQASDAVSGQPGALPADAEDVSNNNRMRGALQAALGVLQLMSPDIALRRAARESLRGAFGTPPWDASM